MFASILHTHLAGKLTFDEDNSHLMLEWINYFLFGSFGQKTLVKVTNRGGGQGT